MQLETSMPHKPKNDTSNRSIKCIPAYGILMERMVLAFPSQPSTLIAVAVEKRRAGPTHKRDLKCA